MYTVIVVDDEEDIRHGIVRSIAWECLGFHVIGEAANGLRAVSLIEALAPDVVLTDIRMPGMDGVELMRYVRENHPQTQVVILSGYSDFTYMQSAIEHNAATYLLKPTDITQFESVFQTIRDRLDQEKSQREVQEKSAVYLRNAQLTQLLQGKKTSAEEISVLLEHSDLRGSRLILIAPRYSVDWFEAHHDWNTTQRVMLSLLNREIRTAEEPISGTFFLYDQRMICGIVYGPQDRIVAFWEAAFEMLRISIDIPPLQTAYSDIIQEEASLPLCFSQARQRLDGDLSPALLATRAEPPSAHMFAVLLTDQQTEKLRMTVDTATQSIVAWSGPNLLEVDRAYMKLLFALSDAASTVSLDLSAALQAAGYAFETLYALESVSGKRCFILYATGLLIRQLPLAKDPTANELLAAQVQAIVGAEFASSQMSLGYIAEKLEKSEAHISRVFKEVTGRSFVHYVRDRRMEQAFALLRDTNYPVYMVAREVGYPDLSNFQRTFKKVYDMTPALCRRKSKGARNT